MVVEGFLREHSQVSKQLTFVDPTGRLTVVGTSVSVLLDFTESQPTREGSSLAKSSPGIDTVTPKSPLLVVAIFVRCRIQARDELKLSGVIRNQRELRCFSHNNARSTIIVTRCKRWHNSSFIVQHTY